MEIQFLLIIIIVLLIIILYNSKYNLKNIEKYDAKVIPTTQRQCGDLCTEAIGCYAFAHKDNGDCFLSKNYILGPAYNSLYAYEYNPADYRCNKFRPMQGLSDAYVPEALKQNAFYTCSDNEEGKYTLQLIADTIYEPVKDFSDVDKIDVPRYKLFDFNWPTQQDQVINLNKEQNANRDYTVYEKSDNEYQGNYLFPEKCTSDISESACLQLCTQYDNCVGVEFNPYYERTNVNDAGNKVYKNICCPKSRIDNIVPRKSEFKNGKFYLKTSKSNLNKFKIYVTSKE